MTAYTAWVVEDAEPDFAAFDVQPWPPLDHGEVFGLLPRLKVWDGSAWREIGLVKVAGF